MKRSYIAWFLFGFLMVAMVSSGVSLAYFTIGKGDDVWLAIASASGLVVSLYLSLVKAPEWFGDNIDSENKKNI